MRRSVLLSLLLLGRFALAGDTGGWFRVDEARGIVVEARDVEGSALHELRATAHAEAPPAAILAVLWKHEEFPQFLSHVTRVEVLEDRGDERLVYQQLAVPVVKDRDIVLRTRKTVDASGTIDVRSAAAPDAGPPPSGRFVRVRVSDGHWHLVPAGGGTDVTYTNRTDVAGLLPDWIVHRVQNQTVAALVRAMLDRAARGR